MQMVSQFVEGGVKYFSLRGNKKVCWVALQTADWDVKGKRHSEEIKKDLMLMHQRMLLLQSALQRQMDGTMSTHRLGLIAG